MKRHLLPALFAALMMLCGTAVGANATGRGEDFGFGFGVRANMLRWATLTPDVGLEWNLPKGWSVLVDATWTSLTFKGGERRYAVAELSPELRKYFGKDGRWYAGAMFQTGLFNHKFKGDGKQGEFRSGSLTGGYRLPLNKALSLDFTLGVGYIWGECDSYRFMDGVRTNSGSGNGGQWGLTRFGVCLVWNIF